MRNFVKVIVPADEYRTKTVGDRTIIRLDGVQDEESVICYECVVHGEYDIEEIEEDLILWKQHIEDLRNIVDIKARMQEIQKELSSLDYLTSKEIDGEDMTEYDDKYDGDWHNYRKQLRIEYRELENLL